MAGWWREVEHPGGQGGEAVQRGGVIQVTHQWRDAEHTQGRRRAGLAGECTYAPAACQQLHQPLSDITAANDQQALAAQRAQWPQCGVLGG
ncbi:hypothetical protein CATMQ487_47490 [Sphaerotilus microaerophilus]|uniref:Uncharacterized protein n=1 Tax=Sphaerotilus microaerophilus TaxID=2914710 RepID=A0ABM7YT11_9BURK|nr:hypothetical protein CATMQ487_47490 [Sphaerotilus sp. FB-5]